ncbi:MAG: hypothetical protein JWP52_2391, partial [Rhizobacter sp.]|nr:hypothetical protein [Rhizobacter sp.]
MPSLPLRPRSLRDVNAEIRSLVRVEQMRMVFGQTMVASVIATAFAVLMAVHFRWMLGSSVVLLWMTFKIAAVVPRMVHGVLFRRKPEPSLRWLRTAQLLLFIDGLSWGCALFMVPADNVVALAVGVASLMGVAAVGSYVLHADWTSCAAYTAPIIGPGALLMLHRGDAMGWYSGVAMLAYLAGLLVSARRSERHIIEMLVLRFNTDRIMGQLSSALDIARTESRAKSEFVANISHELRTPLHGILGLAGELVRSLPSGQQFQQVELIRRSGEHLLSLINDILDFSRVETQGLRLAPESMDLVQLVETTVRMCEPSAAEKQLKLSCRVTIARPFGVRADPFRIRQVLLNLIGNAVKFTDQGGVNVHLDTGDTPGSVLIRVNDTGMGIAPDDMERIFEPFVQVDNSTSRRYGGTGLGLSISRRIARSMGGDILCESTPGIGSVFTCVLVPERAAPAAEAPKPLPPVVMPMPGVGPTPVVQPPDVQHRHTVLLAEDNDVNAIVATSMLERLGIAVERAVDGHEAVLRVCRSSGRPEMVLMDCHMPGMDGFEATRLIRQFERRHNLPRIRIVALTANAAAQDRDRCLTAGMDAHL